ncbi:MAG: hypothetical protein E7517_02200 [Ruminococcaceae bacterium]|nr:hypothetical protein [Oscillospiraceae bacterium]
MKKLLVIFLAAMLIVSLAACSNSKTGEKETSAAATSAATSSQTTEESTANSAAFDKQEAVKNLHFGYAGEANIKDTDNGKMVENKDYNTIVSFQEGKTMKELAESRGLTFAEAVKLNGTEWNKYTFKNEQVSTVLFMVEKDSGTYVVSFFHDVNADINLDADIDAFMNAVTFE